MSVINATTKYFIEWMKDCCELTKDEVIAIDGKAVRGCMTTLVVLVLFTWGTNASTAENRVNS